VKFEFDDDGKIIGARPSLKDLLYLLLIRLPIPFALQKRLIARFVADVITGGLEVYILKKSGKKVKLTGLKVDVKDAGK